MLVRSAWGGTAYEIDLDVGTLSTKDEVLRALGETARFPGDYRGISQWEVRFGTDSVTVSPVPTYG